MKKIMCSLLITLLFIPILVNASSFTSASGISKKYINNFLNPDRYIKTSRGDLISKGEVEQTIVRKDSDNKLLTVSSYMFDGTKYWAKEAYIIGEEIIHDDRGDAKTKVTEIVKHETKVKGTGKYNDSWMFVDSFKVTVKSNGHGTIDGTDLITKSADAHGSVSFVLEPVSGYKYLNNTCGSDVTGNILSISNVEKDIVCYINFETSLYANTLPVPYKVVHINLTNSDVTYRFDNTPQGPVPNTFSSRYLNGYYTDDTLKTRLGKLSTLPSRDGWTFKGYYVGETQNSSTQIINEKGFFETTYSLLKDNDTKEKITFKVEENKYKITFNRDGGTGGTEEVSDWLYEHDMPKIDIPGKSGYVFEGYYSTNPNGTFKYKYYDSEGKAVKIFKMDKAGDLVLKAKWTPCPVGHYCLGDNKINPCPIKQYQDNTGQSSCKLCPVGTYQDQTGQASCKNCVAGSYSASTGQDRCEACQSGKTSNTKSSSCNVNCSNIANVRQWETATWNANNTVTNGCKVKSCNTNYRIENNTCVPDTVVVTLKPENGDRDIPKTVTIGSSFTVSVPTKGDEWGWGPQMIDLYTAGCCPFPIIFDGYFSGNTKVINSDGSLVSGVSGFTNSSGQWTRNTNVTLTAKWHKGHNRSGIPPCYVSAAGC